jgi:hypothetical protein
MKRNVGASDMHEEIDIANKESSHVSHGKQTPVRFVQLTGLDAREIEKSFQRPCSRIYLLDPQKVVDCARGRRIKPYYLGTPLSGTDGV